MSALVRHDYGRRAHLTVRDHKRLRKIAGPIDHLANERAKRQSVRVLWGVFLAGMGVSVVILALCLWWAPK